MRWAALAWVAGMIVADCFISGFAHAFTYALGVLGGVFLYDIWRGKE